jgi:hypothetical protein
VFAELRIEVREERKPIVRKFLPIRLIRKTRRQRYRSTRHKTRFSGHGSIHPRGLVSQNTKVLEKERNRAISLDHRKGLNKKLVCLPDCLDPGLLASSLGSALNSKLIGRETRAPVVCRPLDRAGLVPQATNYSNRHVLSICQEVRLVL